MNQGIAWCFGPSARFRLAATVSIIDEYREIARRVGCKIPTGNPEPWLKWIERKAEIYSPAPLGKQRSRDPDDDPFLSCALASGAKIIVSKDDDLLVLEKPFGIQILSPRKFLALFKRQ